MDYLYNMKTKLYTLIFAITTLFITGCEMKLNGNLICLELESSVDDTLDAYNFTIPQIKQIYRDKGYVSLIYDNDYTETKYIEEEIAEKDEIVLKLGNGKILHIYSDSTVMLFVPDRFNSIYYPIQHYTIKSVSQIQEYQYPQTPTYNEIRNYELSGEVRGDVKSMITKEYQIKEMFGKDSLIFNFLHYFEYDKNSNLLCVKKSSKYSLNALNILHSYKYDDNRQLISERCYTSYEREKITYDIDDKGKQKRVSFYEDSNSSKPSEYDLYKYDQANNLIEIENYHYNEYIDEYYLYRKEMFKKENEDNIISICYDAEGKEKYRNRYDSAYSVIEGLIYLDECKTNFVFSKGLVECEVSARNPNTIVRYKYPYRIERSHYDIVKDEETTYDINCNPIKKVVTIYDTYSQVQSKSEYLILYKYDSHGNWIERNCILIEYKTNVGGFSWDDAETQERGSITYREIEYVK